MTDKWQRSCGLIIACHGLIAVVLLERLRVRRTFIVSGRLWLFTSSEFLYHKNSGSVFICHHPPTLLNSMNGWRLMADIGTIMHVGQCPPYAKGDWLSCKGRTWAWGDYLCIFIETDVLFLFTAAQRQPYPCSTSRLPLCNSNLTDAQR